MSWPPTKTNATRTIFGDLIHFFLENEDLRTKSWFLTSSIWPTLTIVVIYLWLCLYVGPRYMRNRKPFKLKNTMLSYNGFQVAFSALMVYEGYKSGWGSHYNFTCEPVNYGTDPISMRMARAVWMYYMAKITELLDTVFFVLRKKDSQISFLHVYHHSLMPFVALFAVKYYAGGHGTLFCFLNSFIHVVMYAYYLLAAMGPKIQKYLWWKKYLTILQIVQFSIIFVHSIQVQFQSNCNYPKLVAGLLTLNASIFTSMFSLFYIRSYKKDKKRGAIKHRMPSVLKMD